MSKEIVLNDYTFLVSETDEKGIILFANDDFCKIAGYDIDELIGQPHNIIRHKDMPKVAFKDLWETVKKGNIWTGYVKNRAKILIVHLNKFQLSIFYYHYLLILFQN